MGVRGLLSKVERFARPTLRTAPDADRDILLVDGSAVMYAMMGQNRAAGGSEVGELVAKKAKAEEKAEVAVAVAAKEEEEKAGAGTVVEEKAEETAAEAPEEAILREAAEAPWSPAPLVVRLRAWIVEQVAAGYHVMIYIDGAMDMDGANKLLLRRAERRAETQTAVSQLLSSRDVTKRPSPALLRFVWFFVFECMENEPRVEMHIAKTSADACILGAYRDLEERVACILTGDSDFLVACDRVAIIASDCAVPAEAYARSDVCQAIKAWFDARTVPSEEQLPDIAALMGNDSYSGVAFDYPMRMRLLADLLREKKKRASYAMFRRCMPRDKKDHAVRRAFDHHTNAVAVYDRREPAVRLHGDEPFDLARLVAADLSAIRMLPHMGSWLSDATWDRLAGLRRISAARHGERWKIRELATNHDRLVMTKQPTPEDRTLEEDLKHLPLETAVARLEPAHACEKLGVLMHVVFARKSARVDDVWRATLALGRPETTDPKEAVVEAPVDAPPVLEDDGFAW